MLIKLTQLSQAGNERRFIIRIADITMIEPVVGGSNAGAVVFCGEQKYFVKETFDELTGRLGL